MIDERTGEQERARGEVYDDCWGSISRPVTNQLSSRLVLTTTIPILLADRIVRVSAAAAAACAQSYI
jgi:hypothetical protein